MDQAFVTQIASVSSATILVVQLAKKIHVKVEGPLVQVLALIVAAVINTGYALIKTAPNFEQFSIVSTLIASIFSGIGSMGGYDTLMTLFMALFVKKNMPADPAAESTTEVTPPPYPDPSNPNWEPGDA